MKKLRLAILFSGGKDSTFTVFEAIKQKHVVVCLVSMKPVRDDSYMYHVPNLHLVESIANCLDLPLIIADSCGEKEKEVEDLFFVLRDLKKNGLINAVGAGALASQYQKERVEKICKELGLDLFAPMWKINQLDYLKELLKNRFEIIFVGVAALGLDEKWLGRKLDKKAVVELIELNKKYCVSVVGEGGEFETLVLDCPVYRKKLAIAESEKKWNGVRGELLVKKIKITSKTRKKQ